nr:putative RNA-directed DNA polymerase [Tanacetum cinerariifolium]
MVRKKASHQIILGVTNETYGIATGLITGETDGMGLSTKGFRRFDGQKKPTTRDDKSHLKCEECGMNRHTKDQCFKIIGYLDWWTDGHKTASNKGVEKDKPSTSPTANTRNMKRKCQEKTFSSVAKIDTIRVLLSVASNQGWSLNQFDVKNAFLHGELKEVYMEAPPGFSEHFKPGEACRLKKSLYGLKQSPRAWFRRFTLAMKRYLKGTAGHGVLFRSNGHLNIQMYTYDDWAGDKGNRRSTSGYFFLVGGNLVTWRSKKQKVVSLSSAEAEFRGIAKGLAEALWIRKLVSEIGFTPRGSTQIMKNRVPCLIIYVDDMVITKNDEEEIKRLKEGLFKEFEIKDLGNLKYFLGIEVLGLPKRIFIYIAYAVGVVSRFMHQPQVAHMNAALRIVRCWAGDKGNRRSTSGYFSLVGGNLVTWRSKKQKVVSLSSAEAEFRGIAKGLAEALWIRKLVSKIGFPPRGSTQIMCDNKATIQISENPVQHNRKNVEVDRHFIKEKLEAGIIELPFVKSSYQLADILTKAVGTDIFHKCLSKLKFGNLTIQLEGGVGKENNREIYGINKFQAQDSQVLFPNLPHSRTLNSTDRDYLERLVTLEEIKEAVWDFGSSKACGPDGFSLAFVKKYWDIIQKDLYDFINSFFTSSELPYGANSSFFTLIPKVNNPTLITDFCPVSLIGIHYKIIANILAYRLSKVIDKIVSKEQSAFISGRQILDSPIILSEIIEWYKKRKKQLLIFKVDFEKAFDSISWKYLDHILDRLGLDIMVFLD